MTAAEVAAAIAPIRQHPTGYGRRIDEDHFGVLFNYCFAENSAEAARLARPHALCNRTDPDFTETSALGTAQDIIDTIQSFIDAGASRFVGRPACPRMLSKSRSKGSARTLWRVGGDGRAGESPEVVEHP